MRNEQNRPAVILSEAGKRRIKTVGRCARIILATMQCRRHKAVAQGQQRRPDRVAVGRRRVPAEEFNKYVASDRLGPNWADHATDIGVDSSTVFVETASDTFRRLCQHHDPANEGPS